MVHVERPDAPPWRAIEAPASGSAVAADKIDRYRRDYTDPIQSHERSLEKQHCYVRLHGDGCANSLVYLSRD